MANSSSADSGGNAAGGDSTDDNVGNTDNDTGGDDNSGFLSGIKEGISGIANGISSIIDTIISIPETIVNGIGELLKTLFIPEEGFLNDNIESMRDDVPIIDDIVLTMNNYEAVLSSSGKAPKIKIDLPAKYGGSVILDFAFYTPYKAKGDFVMSAFMWGVFLWKLFMKLPGIIQGLSTFNDSAMTTTIATKGDFEK